MANLLEFSRDIMARTNEGREALVALLAVRTWKGSPEIRRTHKNLADYHDILTELHAAKLIKFSGGDFMSTGTKDGHELGLELHRKWTAAGRPGSFKAFIEAQGKDGKPDAPAKATDDAAEKKRLAIMRGFGR